MKNLLHRLALSCSLVGAVAAAVALASAAHA